MYRFKTNSIDETKELGRMLAKYLKKGDIVVLNGELGSGKTALVTGFMSFFNRENDISSPTFTIVNEHELSDDEKLFHFDVYRLENEDEFYAIGGEEYFEKGISFIEWGERIANALPKCYLEIQIEKEEENENVRVFNFIPHGNRYEELINDIEIKQKEA